jgi:hypothetical protein
VGKLVDRAGWNGAFGLMIACALATLALMAFTWNVGAHPQAPPSPRGFPVEPVREPTGHPTEP